MRLSMSGDHTGDAYALEAAIGNARGDEGLPQSDLLNEFAEAVCSRDEERTREARRRIVAALGEAAMVDAAAVIAAFNGYPRVADATGIPLEDYKEEVTAGLRTELELDVLNHSKTAS